MQSSEQTNGNQITIVNVLSWLLAVGLTLFAVVVGFYFLNFRGPLSKSQEQWGQFGDFLGGTLNPLFAFLSLIALVLTVSMQRRQLELAREQLHNSRLELEATRAELTRTADAQSLAAVAQARQAEAAALATKLAALTSALTVVDNLIKDARASNMSRDDENYVVLQTQRKRLLGAIFEITNEQLRHAAA